MSGFHKIEFRSDKFRGGKVLLDGNLLKGVTKIEICSDVAHPHVVKIEMICEEIIAQLDEAHIESSRCLAAASSHTPGFVDVSEMQDENERLIPVEEAGPGS